MKRIFFIVVLLLFAVPSFAEDKIQWFTARGNYIFDGIEFAPNFNTLKKNIKEDCLFFNDKTHSSIFFTRKYHGREWSFYYWLNRNELDISIDIPDSESEALHKEIFEMLSKNSVYHWESAVGKHDTECRYIEDCFDISSEYGHRAMINLTYIQYGYNNKPSSIVIEFRER